MAYRVRNRGQFTTPVSRSGRGFTYDRRRVLVKGDNFQINWNGPQVVASILDSISEAFSNLSDEALAYMQDKVPYDTGALHDSCFVVIQTEGLRTILVIGAGMPYAIYVELGTAHTPSQPYIRPTFDMVVSRLPGLLNSEVARRARTA